MAMPLPSEEDLARLLDAIQRSNGIIAHAAKELGLPDSTARRWREFAARKGMLGTEPVMPGFELAKTTAVYDQNGILVREFVQQRPERGAEFEVPEGHTIKGVSALVGADGREVQRWVKTREADKASDNLDAIKDAFCDLKGRATLGAPAKAADADLLTLYPIPDLHFGGRAWAQETGENWDLDIAIKTVRECMGDLVSQSRPAQHAVLLGLGDLFHTNDRTNMTPRSGHILDVDGRWAKVYKAGTRVIVDLISLVAERHLEVEIRMLPGNHDPDASVTLSVALALYFEKHKRITVNDSPSMHYYRRFGKVLFGATHGHTMKPDAMAMMLAADCPEDWGKSKFRHLFFGHVHHEMAKEIGAVRVESFNSPAGRDAYAAAGGWRAGRSFQALTFHRERGEIGRHRVNIS